MQATLTDGWSMGKRLRKLLRPQERRYGNRCYTGDINNLMPAKKSSIRRRQTYTCSILFKRIRKRVAERKKFEEEAGVQGGGGGGRRRRFGGEGRGGRGGGGGEEQ